MKPSLIIGLLVFVIAFGFGVKEIQDRNKRREEQRKAQKSVENALDELKKESARALEAGETGDTVERLGRMQNALESAGKAHDGPERKVLAASAKIVKETQVKMAALEALQGDVEMLFDFQSLKERGMVETRRQKAQALLKANVEFTDFLKGASARFRTLLVEERLNEARIEGELKAFKQSMAKTEAPTQKVRQSEIELIKALIQKYDLCEKEWGKWKANEEHEMTFESAEAGKKFDELSEVMNKAIEVGQAGTAELLELQKKK